MKNKTGYVLLTIMIMEFFLSLFFGLMAGANRQLNGAYVYVFIISAYTVIAIMLLNEKHPIESFSLDSVSLLIVIASCFVRGKFYIEDEVLYLAILFLLGLSITVIVIKRRLMVFDLNLKNIPPIFLWVFITIAIIAMAEIAGAKMLNPIASVKPQLDILQEVSRIIIYQISWVTVVEEVYFRGFIPEYLIKFGFKEKNAFIIQAVVFWLMHFRKITTPLTFFINIPLLTISTTMVVWHYKKISVAILIHTLVNVTGSLIVYYLT